MGGALAAPARAVGGHKRLPIAANGSVQQRHAAWWSPCASPERQKSLPSLGGLTGGPVAVIRRAHRRCATGAQGTATRRPTAPGRVCRSSCAGFAGKVRRPGRVCGDGSHLVLDTLVRPVRRRDGQHRQDHLGAPDRRAAPGQGGEAIRPHGSMTAPRRCRLRDGQGRRPASPSPTLGRDLGN
jgi:hypothetical protein